MATTYKDCLRAVEREKRRSLGTNLQRPLTGYEQQIVYGLYSFATFVDLGKGVMQKRNAHIKRAAARMGLIKWACMSLFTDYMSQLTPEAQDTFARRAHHSQLSVVTRQMEDRHDGWKMCKDKDLKELAGAAWQGTCQYCALTGQEAKRCKLRKTLDGLQCLEPSDSPDCWYKAF